MRRFIGVAPDSTGNHFALNASPRARIHTVTVNAREQASTPRGIGAAAGRRAAASYRELIDVQFCRK